MASLVSKPSFLSFCMMRPRKNLSSSIIRIFGPAIASSLYALKKFFQPNLFFFENKFFVERQRESESCALTLFRNKRNLAAVALDYILDYKKPKAGSFGFHPYHVGSPEKF